LYFLMKSMEYSSLATRARVQILLLTNIFFQFFFKIIWSLKRVRLLSKEDIFSNKNKKLFSSLWQGSLYRYLLYQSGITDWKCGTTRRAVWNRGICQFNWRDKGNDPTHYWPMTSGDAHSAENEAKWRAGR